MIQKNTVLNVIDNSGAKKARCIYLLNSGYRKRYCSVGDLVLVSIKELRLKRRKFSKVKKGELLKALVVRTKISKQWSYSAEVFTFFENAIVLLSSKNKLLGTRIFGCLPCDIRFTKYSRLISLSAGVIR